MGIMKSRVSNPWFANVMGLLHCVSLSRHQHELKHISLRSLVFIICEVLLLNSEGGRAQEGALLFKLIFA